MLSTWFRAWVQPGFGSGSASEGTNSEHLPAGGTPISDSLYLLYSPPRETPDVDIIFFHGLQPVTDVYTDAYWNTWSSDGGKTAWPQKLLGEQAFPRARIFSVKYDSAVEKSSTHGRGDLFRIAENLVHDIIESDAVAERGQSPVGRLPIVLVGHSLGGLVIKKFLLFTCEMKCDLDPHDGHDKVRIAKLDEFVKNVRGVFYYSTPHHGTTLADVANQIPDGSDVLIFLKTLSHETERLNERFGKWRKKNKIKASTISENLETSFSIFGVKSRASEVIVTEASARYDSEDYYTANQTHVNVCKPDNTVESRFSKLQQFITTNVQEVRLREEEDLMM